MKIQLASDLHLEFLQHNYPGERLISPIPGADILVLAGDIASGTDALRLFANWSTESKPTPIIFLAGNHEFYGHVLDPMHQKFKEAAQKYGIHYLEKETLVIDGVRFLGTTLWTDYKLDPGRTQEQQMRDAGECINDHRLIRTGRNLFTPADALKRHYESREWLTQELAKPWEGKTVVVTHHGPHPLSVHPRYAKSDVNSAFNSDLSELMPSVDLWLHGHVHDCFDYRVGRCRVVANPAGYIKNRYASREKFVFESQTFNPTLLLEV